jgi:hypothetical protein
MEKENLTAVEWLYMKSKERELDVFDLQQAKAMEKEQSKIDYETGQASTKFKFPLSAEQYYKETYGK